jgi:hypothetical protein
MAARDRLDEKLNEIAKTNLLKVEVLKKQFDVVAQMVLCERCRQRSNTEGDYWLSSVKELNNHPLPRFDPYTTPPVGPDRCSNYPALSLERIRGSKSNTVYNLLKYIGAERLSRKELKESLEGLATSVLCWKHYRRAKKMVWEWLWILEDMVELEEEEAR